MSTTLIKIKDFLGKYYQELNYSAIQEKYKNTRLDTFFEQRFQIQNNKVQMIVDPSISDLTISISGNEIHISKELYDHSGLKIINTLENNNQNTNPKNLYNAETFSTIAYLICQNHTIFQITGSIDQPIYVKYKSDFESFYNSVVLFEIADDISVEIVEEIQSSSALNSVTNYVLHPRSNVKLTTFYQNNLPGISFVYRNIIAQENSKFSHILLGRGSSNIIDENKLMAYSLSRSEFLGIITSTGKDFHSILYIQPAGEDYFVNVDYRDVLFGKADVTFFPVILGQEPTEKATIIVSNINVEEFANKEIAYIETELKNYLGDIIDRTVVQKVVGSQRFYDNKNKFLHFP